MMATGLAPPEAHRKDLGWQTDKSPYSPPTVDIWSVGCIMAELLQGKALFPGNDCILGKQDQAGVPFSGVGVDPGPFWEVFSLPCAISHGGSLS